MTTDEEKLQRALTARDTIFDGAGRYIKIANDWDRLADDVALLSLRLAARARDVAIAVRTLDILIADMKKNP